MTGAGRERFLRNPEPAELRVPRSLAGHLERVGEALDRARAQPNEPGAVRAMAREEARASAHIEGEYDEARIAEHARALESCLRQPPGENSLLRLHRRTMRGQPHAQPGEVPDGERLRGRLESARGGTRSRPDAGTSSTGCGNDPAACPWPCGTHVRFETIHPFADGNGRTGRALMQQVMGTRLPVSPFILRERSAYYELFRMGDWPRWLEWFCRGLAEEWERYREG